MHTSQYRIAGYEYGIKSTRFQIEYCFNSMHRTNNSMHISFKISKIVTRPDIVEVSDFVLGSFAIRLEAEAVFLAV